MAIENWFVRANRSRHGDAQRASPIDMRMTSAPQPKQES